ncbi:MAG TPA: hypothetical protein H9951_02575 [Candidatus Bacteroides intestinigallinarum]|nr:hypothetical protein [Candidatus Bacteroides intestinigallinarum]
MTISKILFINLIFSFSFIQCFAQTKALDEIVFGDVSSEKKHTFSEKATQAIKGGLGESARILLPIEGSRIEGGNMTFKMRVDPNKQNYFTARFWGSDTGNNNILILFCEGKQIGYRHLGDYDMLDIANESAPFPGRFTYTTLPLPLHMTRGKEEIELSIRSTGYIFRYGETLDTYQKIMKEPTKALYKGYIHTETCFIPSKKEKQGKVPLYTLRTAPGEEVIDSLKRHVNNVIERMLTREILSQDELWILACAYHVTWSKVYHDSAIIKKTIITADHYCSLYKKDPKSVYDGSWLTVGPLCIAINYFIPEIREILDIRMMDGKTRREAWTEMFEECMLYAKAHRRQYTNQSMIVDLHLYSVNRILSILAPEKALPAYQTLKYIYESMGIAPWLGSETSYGPEMPLGKNYYQLSKKGLTKELGFVGGYGEIFNWMVHLYEITGERGIVDSRDPMIRTQLLKMMKARSYFRYPALDNEGYRAMRAEESVGWRDHGSYPGHVLYGEKNGREATPIMAAAATLDPMAVAFAQQMMDENQFFALVKEKMSDNTLNSIHTMLRIPDEYELIKKEPHRGMKLPMSQGMPDTIFSDEEVGVVALKNGDEILYASLYWRANYAINFLAKVHYITPEIDRVATVFQDIKFTDSGYTYKRPERTNLAFSDNRNFYSDVKSAHTGEELPIAKVPEGIKYHPGEENSFAGKGDFYTLCYGKYLIAMNCTKKRSFTLEIPKAKSVIEFSSKKQIKETSFTVKPMSTVVLIIK